MKVRTRFAPSPTGFLHIGGARTALFNYLFAKKHQGDFLLRIEDTDKARSTQAACDAIFQSLEWLGIQHDEQAIYQSSRAARHQEVAKQLLEQGKAYYCFSTQEEIDQLRQQALANKQHFIFHSPWRDKSPEDYPKDQKPVVRIKAEHAGETVIEDLVQGKVTMQNSHLDDMVLLRGDGTPTYMLSVVVDDHDMAVTHIIRGDDHLNNAFRQAVIYRAMGWDIPQMAHIPLIHGDDGAKLSKRHGALGVHEYQQLGYLPEAINNYLLRLGWSHGDDEIISREQAIEWFDTDGLGKSAARLDYSKMQHINAYYLRNKEDSELAEMVYLHYPKISPASKQNILAAIPCMKPRAILLDDLYQMAPIFMVDEASCPLKMSPESIEIIKMADQDLLKKALESLQKIENFNRDELQNNLKELAKSWQMKLGELMKILRALITGQTSSPSVFDIMEIIGKDETLARLSRC